MNIMQILCHQLDAPPKLRAVFHQDGSVQKHVTVRIIVVLIHVGFTSHQKLVCKAQMENDTKMVHTGR